MAAHDTGHDRALIVRQTFLDRDCETPADLHIERIGGDGKPNPISAQRPSIQGLKQSAGLVVSCAALFSNWAAGFKKHTNELPKFDDSVSMGAGGDPNICYYHSYWQLGPEEALVIEANATRVRVMELPARQLLDGISRLPLPPNPRQQAHGPLPR